MAYLQNGTGKGSIKLGAWAGDAGQAHDSPTVKTSSLGAPPAGMATTGLQLDYPRSELSGPQPVASTSYDTDSTALIPKFDVKPTSSRRLQGLADLGLMAALLLPTILLRFVRTAMGLVGITEHRWRGISMHVPLTLDDRRQLEALSANLVSGHVGRRPEPPARGPVAPSQQLLLDLHVILAAASLTASAFGLPYEGMPEAALHGRLGSYVRSLASSDSVCTQDCFKAMRKMGRKQLVALCSAAPRRPTSTAGPGAPSARLRSSPSTSRMMAQPDKKAVAKAFMSACLMQSSSAYATTLVGLVARLPDGSGDLVESISLIPLDPGAEYLRLLNEGVGPGRPAVGRFAEQLEAMCGELGRARPSDAKKEPEVQGMAINARVHEIGVVRYDRLDERLLADVGWTAPDLDPDDPDGLLPGSVADPSRPNKARRVGPVAEAKRDPDGSSEVIGLDGGADGIGPDPEMERAAKSKGNNMGWAAGFSDAPGPQARSAAAKLQARPAGAGSGGGASTSGAGEQMRGSEGGQETLFKKTSTLRRRASDDEDERAPLVTAISGDLDFADLDGPSAGPSGPSMGLDGPSPPSQVAAFSLGDGPMPSLASTALQPGEAVGLPPPRRGASSVWGEAGPSPARRSTTLQNGRGHEGNAASGSPLRPSLLGRSSTLQDAGGSPSRVLNPKPSIMFRGASTSTSGAPAAEPRRSTGGGRAGRGALDRQVDDDGDADAAAGAMELPTEDAHPLASLPEQPAPARPSQTGGKAGSKVPDLYGKAEAYGADGDGDGDGDEERRPLKDRSFSDDTARASTAPTPTPVAGPGANSSAPALDRIATATVGPTVVTTTTTTGGGGGKGKAKGSAGGLPSSLPSAGALSTTGHSGAATPSTARGRTPHHKSPPPRAFTAAHGPSTSIYQYPTAALDVFDGLYGCPRSGAFAVHGREPRGVGLSRLVTAYASCHALPAPAQSALLRGLGYSHLEELREEVELRRALCVAQALPVIVASLRLMLRSPACLAAAARTGAFLHVQQSLLSDLHRHERSYLEDTKGALDVLSERLVVRFVPGSGKVLPLQISGAAITVSLPADAVPPAALAAAGLDPASFLDASYGLSALLFNMGINSLQSLGFLMWSGVEPLQDTLNRHSLERLNDYAQRAGAASGPALAALNAHFGPRAQRKPKDTAMFGLVRRACSEVGGGRAVNCKSGKDRTALELSKAFAEEVVSAGLLPASSRPWLEAQFLRGLSYVVTSQNHGQPPAYAFNEMEIVTLPPGWRPDWRLCGKVSS
ncbi:hypothetical protein HYH03_016624 [Edaphochlamys debaryana]|uniref:Uncharacterized protein n=1 Tax=Edaphochlamys debaryana TaxID=47281 RepID=A0A835XLT1_9CHLO|nr:hypothetical protein HYH03_016624 [Edaphochlamys debaryana]|eukprot:KAG2484581.1 hypothetical protein HYH03_016624 [Edaphochlamys debaryana]